MADHRRDDRPANNPGEPVMTQPQIPSRALILGREPAVLAELVASVLVVLNLFLLPGLNDVIQGTINAVVLAGASIYVAIRVKSDNLLPLLIGGFKATVAMVVALGVDLDVPQQAGLLTLLSLVAALFVRSNVNAPITVTGQVLYNRPAA